LSLESRLTYRFRSLGGDKDSDFYSHWFLRGRDLFESWFDLYFSGRVHRDLHGTSDSQTTDLFTGVEDRNPDWQEQIYQLNGYVHHPEKPLRHLCRSPIRERRRLAAPKASRPDSGGLFRLPQLRSQAP
jgi:hypothetical protein